MKTPFPVGEVQMEYLDPMDFEEFLWTTGNTMLADAIKEHFYSNASFPEIIHNQAIDLYKQYLCIGGMPASINDFVEKNKDLVLANISAEIIEFK